MIVPSSPVSQLSPMHRPALARHFLALDTEDRCLRFGAPLARTARTSHASISSATPYFGVFDEDLERAGVAHVARLDGEAELGISVLRAA